MSHPAGCNIAHYLVSTNYAFLCNIPDDGFDETLVPVDFGRCGQIRDDYLFQKLVCPMKEGVTMTCLFDCCHSGTVLDLPYVFKGDGSQESMSTPASFDATKIEQAANAQDDDNDDNDDDGGDEVDSDAAVEPEEATAAVDIPPPPKRNSQSSKPTKRPSASATDDGPPEPEYEPTAETKEVFVRYGRDSIIIHADIDETFLKIKELLEDKTGVPVDEQHIVYNGLGIKFKDDKTLRYYGCTGGAFLTMTKK